MAPEQLHRFTVILEAEAGGGFSVHCPVLPGCVSQGEDRNSALANIREVIRLVLGVAAGKLPVGETPAGIAGEVREILEGRRLDGLPYAGVSIDQVEVAIEVFA